MSSSSILGNAPGAAIVWFRDDLRLADHAPLTEALGAGLPVIACYVLDDGAGPGSIGAAGKWWLHGSLASLAQQLEDRGGALVLRRGEPAQQVASLVRECAAVAVHCHRSYTPDGRRHEQELDALLRPLDVELRTHPGALLFEPDSVTTRAGGPFRVFTPFRRACMSEPDPRPELPVPSAAKFSAMHGAAGQVDHGRLEDLQLLPRAPDWSAGLAAAWQPGEPDAHGKLEQFVAGPLADYAKLRDFPARDGTSRLSPHLRFGEISPRTVWHASSAFAAADAAAATGADAFLRELLWREFSSHLLWHFPTLPERSFRGEFDDAFPWSADTDSIRAWRRGATGFPLVDAGMRELWRTGWMHNRVRMAVASFLVKDLLVPWQRGAAWFMDTLVDGDVANNAVNWQWVAGSGVDAAPYFRIFNPALQGRRFDADGAYVRRWVPELAKLDPRHIHAPDRAPAAALTDAGIRLGEDYPRPVVDHAAARQRALAAFEAATGRA